MKLDNKTYDVLKFTAQIVLFGDCRMASRLLEQLLR